MPMASRGGSRSFLGLCKDGSGIRGVAKNDDNRKDNNMEEIPVFFVSIETKENQEEVYSNFAKLCGRPVPKEGERIYSITYIHNSEEWTATVGEPLRGIRHRTSRSRGRRVEETVQLSDRAIVLAIFPGPPYVVVTNHQIVKDVSSTWENPFFVGQPKSILYFSVA